MAGRIETGGTNINELMAVESTMATKLSGMNDPITGQPILNPMDKIRAAMAGQQYIENSVKSPGNIVSMGEDMALIQLGVANAVDRFAVRQLMGSGQQEKAVQLIASLTGRNPRDPEVLKSIRTKLNIPLEQFFRAQERVAGETAASRAAYERIGLGGRAAVLRGGVTGAIAGAAATEALRGTGFFGAAAGDIERQEFGVRGGGAGRLRAAAPLLVTPEERLEARQAGEYEASLYQSAERIAATQGKAVTQAIMDAVSSGFQLISKQLDESSRQLGGKAAPMAPPTTQQLQDAKKILNRQPMSGSKHK